MHKKSDAPLGLNYLSLNFDYLNFGDFEIRSQMKHTFGCLWDGFGSSNWSSDVCRRVCRCSLYYIELMARIGTVETEVLLPLHIEEGLYIRVKIPMSKLPVYFIIDSECCLAFPLPFERVLKF